MTNIFICYTPLHTIIAGKILELEKIQDFILIYYYREDNAKHKYYFDKISKKARRSFYININNRILTALQTFYYIYRELKKEPRPVNFYAGHIKTIYTRMVIFLTGNYSLFTFDDGLGNVSGEGYLFKGKDAGFFSRLLSFFHIYFTYASLIGKIKKHYTIYTLPNIMPNTFHINLFGNNGGSGIGEWEETSILLTNPLSEYKLLDIEIEKSLYRNVIEKYNISYVIPHPGERVKKINGNVKIIESEKIAEEILLDMKQQYKRIKVFGIYSSALLNLNGIEGLEMVNIHCNLKASFDKMKAIFSSVNIGMVNIN